MGQFGLEQEPLDISKWRELLETAYDESWWSRLSDDDNHYRIVERIGQPLRVKLLYDSYLWKWLLAQSHINSAEQVVELLPGWSHTIAVALESLGFSGKLLQVDLELPHANRTLFPFERVWVKQSIFDLQEELSQASLIIGHHILDDILICQANATDDQRKTYYSSPTLSQSTWGQLAQHPSLSTWIEATASCIANIASRLTEGQTLVLREYPSTTATRQGDNVRWSIELAVQNSVFERLATMEQVSVTIPDLSQAPVPAGCRFPSSVIIVTRS